MRPWAKGRGCVETDLLLLESRFHNDDPNDVRARLVIVETKLRENREIQHKVLGQILEYASKLARASGLAARLKNMAKDRKPPIPADSCTDAILKKAVEAAKKGDIRLLIVAHTIPGDLARSVSFIPKLLISAIGLEVAATREDEVVVVRPRTDASGGGFEASVEFLNALETPSWVVIEPYTVEKDESGVLVSPSQAHRPGGSDSSTEAGWDPEEVNRKFQDCDPAFGTGICFKGRAQGAADEYEGTCFKARHTLIPLRWPDGRVLQQLPESCLPSLRRHGREFGWSNAFHEQRRRRRQSCLRAGSKCWRRYRFGGWVTMADPVGFRSLEEFYAHYFEDGGLKLEFTPENSAK